MVRIAGHVFISYVREDAAHVDRLQAVLENAGIRVWRDTATLWPGEDWRLKIRQAITDDSLVFLACFSQNTASRTSSFQNEELRLAIEQLQKRRPDSPWLIPVRFDDCEIPTSLLTAAGHWARSTTLTFSVTATKETLRGLSERSRRYSGLTWTRTGASGPSRRRPGNRMPAGRWSMR